MSQTGYPQITLEILKTMPRGLLAGLTDYSHQTFRDILDDLNDWKANLISTTDDINTILMNLQNNGYWNRVPDDFSILVMYVIKFFETSTTEISVISHDLEIEVQENHISRLRSLAKTAHKLSLDFGQVWHREYEPKDYGEPNFNNTEKIYVLGRGMAVDMVDLSNVAARLEDFLGMKSGYSKKDLDSNQINITGNISGSTIIIGNENKVQNSQKK